jgi:hypothetical protein
VTRSLGKQLPDSVRGLLDGSDLAQREGLTFLLLTNDEDNWPQVAMLSVGEVVSTAPDVLHAGLWLHSGTSKNLTRSGRGTLVLVANGNGYYVRVSATRGADLDLGAEGRLAYFVLNIEDVQEDSADYAKLTSGVTFKLKDPRQVVPRWQHTVDALKAAGLAS